MPLRRLAAAQPVVVAGDIARNVVHHVDLARDAVGRGAGLVLFPELSLTGYELELAAELAFTPDDPRVEPLRTAARELRATLVVGAPIRLQDAQHGERLHIGAFVFDADGGMTITTKTKLGQFPPEVNPGGPVPPAEWSVFAPGDRHPPIDLCGMPAGIGICADVGRPEHSADAVARGARTYLASIFVPPCEVEQEQSKVRGYARTHGIVVALSNHGGPTGGLPGGGGSGIWDDRGEPVAVLDRDGVGVAIAIEDDAGWSGAVLG